ncbi:MAG: CHASE2 domain-containing protein [Saprospiraceae bacterium]
MLRRLIYPHSLIVTCLLFVLIWFLDTIRINLHFLNPFNETLRDYEITDIVYSRLRDDNGSLDNRIVLVNTGDPNRDTLRMMIDRIVGAGAKVVAADVLLKKRMEPHTDSLLQASLRQIENIVIGVQLDGYNEETEIFEFQANCDTFFCDHVYSGFTNFPANETRTIRLFSPKEMTADGECFAFATRTTMLYDPQAAERFFKRNKEVEEIYFSGNADQFVQFEPSTILDTTIDLRQQLRDKIVLIGYLGISEWDDRDRFYTPLNPRYTGRNMLDMYGVVIHANVIQMILDGKYVRELSFWVNLLLTFVFCYFNIHLFYQVFRRVSLPYQFITRFLQLGEIIILFFIVALLFHFYRIKMDVAYWITALLLTFDAVKFYDNAVRKRFAFLNRIPHELPPPKKKTPKPAPKTIEEPNEIQPAAIDAPAKTDSK